MSTIIEMAPRSKPKVAPYILNDIHTDISIAKQYIQELQTYLPCSLSELIEKARMLCPELKTFSESHKKKFSTNDKGIAGKLVELHIFGRLPNNNSAPDLSLGDIKATHIRPFKKIPKRYTAMNRLTITNVGAPSNYDNLQHILDFELEENPRWGKVYQGILIILEHTEGQWSSEEKVLNERVRGFFHYDINDDTEWMNVINDDYEKIRECVRAKNVTQAGQTYLHIHPHGPSRAFGFTKNFVTRLICHYTNRTLCESGRSLYFEDD